MELLLTETARVTPELFHILAQEIVSLYDSWLSDLIWWCSMLLLGGYKISKNTKPFNDSQIKYLDRNSNNSTMMRMFKTSMKRFGIDTKSLESRRVDVDVADDVDEYFEKIYAKRSGLKSQSTSTSSEPIERQLLVSGWLTNQTTVMSGEVIDTIIAPYIKNLNINKARGIDGLSPKLIRDLNYNQTLVKPMSLLFRLCIATGQTPTKWNDAITSLIPKDRNDAATVDKRRPISVLPIFRRIFEGVYLQLIKSDDVGVFGPSDDILPKAQAGFRPNCSTLSHLITVHDLMVYGYKQVVFFDLYKAYDMVDIERLIDKLSKLGQPLVFLNLVRSLYTGGTAKFVVNGNLSKGMIKYCGLMQGALWSPLLFNIYSIDLPDRIPTYPTELSSPIKKFADDTMIIRPGKEYTETFLNDIKSIEAWCCDNAMLLNTLKTILLQSRLAENNNLAITDGSGCIIPTSLECKYLGFIFTSNGIDIDLNIAKRLEEAKKIFRFIQMVSWHWNQYTRLNIYKTFIRSKLEYGGALIYQLYISNMNLYKNSFVELEKFQQDCIRWILHQRQTYQISSAELGVLQIQPIVERFKSLHARTNLHVLKLVGRSSDIRDYWLNVKYRLLPPTTILLNRLINTNLYQQYKGLVSRWENGGDWIVNRKILLKKRVDTATGQPASPPSLEQHIKLVQRQEHKSKSKLNTLIPDSARLSSGFGPARFFKIKTSAVRHYAIQWSLNNFGHHHACPFLENNRTHRFKRSCLTAGHIDLIGISIGAENLSNQDSDIYILNRNRYIESFDENERCQQYTILDDLLNRQEYVKFGLVVADLLYKLNCKALADNLLQSIFIENHSTGPTTEKLDRIETITFIETLDRQLESRIQTPAAGVEAIALPGPSGIG